MHSGRTRAGADPRAADPQTARTNKLDLVERLADDLAHEIKNPLHSMVINLEVLKRRIARPGGSPAEELLRYVGVVGGELERVNRRIELLLRLVRPDRGGADPTTFEGILEELLELLELERERRGVSVRYEPSTVPVRGYLPLDPSRQLVLGLLLDSVELLPPGGDLAVRTEVDPPWARLRIEGSVVADGDLAPARLREELDSRLAVARALAEALGGQLDLGAEDGPPVCLVLSIPLAPSAP